MQPYIVFIKTDEQNRIININSSAFLHDFSGWVEIDRGYGDKYHHAQGNYFLLPILDKSGVCRYKLSDGQPVERTQAEMNADRPKEEAGPSTEDRLTSLETENAHLKEALELLISGEVGADG